MSKATVSDQDEVDDREVVAAGGSGALFGVWVGLEKAERVAGGMLYVNSGYADWGGIPGNVLLAFSVDGK